MEESQFREINIPLRKYTGIVCHIASELKHSRLNQIVSPARRRKKAAATVARWVVAGVRCQGLHCCGCKEGRKSSLALDENKYEVKMEPMW